MAPLNLFNNISNYEKISINEACKKIAGLKLRLGAYGDSGCIDQSIIDKLVKASKSHLGYTHQWNHKKASTNPAHTMASVETLDQKTAANKKGFRTFRVVNNINNLLTDEILCPASKESKHNITCDKCGLCAGITSTSKKNIAIVAHGNGKNHLNSIGV